MLLHNGMMHCILGMAKIDLDGEREGTNEGGGTTARAHVSPLFSRCTKEVYMPIKSSWLFISPNVLDLRASQCRNPNLFLKTRQGFCYAFSLTFLACNDPANQNLDKYLSHFACGMVTWSVSHPSAERG